MAVSKSMLCCQLILVPSLLNEGVVIFYALRIKESSQEKATGPPTAIALKAILVRL